MVRSSRHIGYAALFLLPLLVLPSTVQGQQACTVTSNFNGTPLPAGSYLWFNAVVSVKGVNARSVELLFSNSSITFSVNHVPQTITVPDGQLIFSPNTTTATTTFNPNLGTNGTWVTNVPSSGNLGKDFIVGVAVPVPAGGWPGGINPVTWTGTYETNATGVTVQWQWATAVYTQFTTNYGNLGVKPVDSNTENVYPNSDHAGTPENYKPYVIGGARGGGGSNWTGSYSATGACPVSPIPPQLGPNSCNPAALLSVLLGPNGATAYVPNGNWISPNTGIQVVPIEPPGPATSIATRDVVNSCSSDSGTGETVCTANGTDVYLINGTTVNATLTSGSTGEASTSGGNCNNCGVVIEPNSNTAVIEMGLSGSPSGWGMQFLNLNTNTFSAPAAAAHEISEDVVWDPIRNLILSPGEGGYFDLFSTSGGTEYSANIGGTLDSAAEDCLTGIALSTDEFTDNLVITDLTQATYTGSSWSAPLQFEAFPEYSAYEGPESGTDGIAIATGTHLGIVTGEFPFPPSQANAIIAIHLPDSSGTGIPALKDYAVAVMPNDPDGYPFSMGCDPHTVTAYVSPTTGKAMGLLAEYGPVTCYQGGSPQYVALVDIHALLDAPRLSDGHTVDPNYDLMGNNIVTFVATH